MKFGSSCLDLGMALWTKTILLAHNDAGPSNYSKEYFLGVVLTVLRRQTVPYVIAEEGEIYVKYQR